MPQPPKYTVKQRIAVHDLYWEGRESHTKKARGKYTLRQIEKLTGVKAGMAWMIARGKR